MLKMFRWQGLLSFLIVVGLLLLFWMFYASTMIKSTIESYGSDIVGAKVEVANVNLSFNPLGIVLNNLEVTDAEHPMKNIVQWEQINAQVALTPLFSGKVIIQDISMKGLAFNTDRERSGALAVAKKTSEKQAETDTKVKGDSSVPDATDSDLNAKLPSVSEILSRETLLTEERGQTFKNSLERSETELDDTLKKLPGKQAIQQYRSELNVIVKGKVTSLADFQQRKKKLSALKKRMSADKIVIQNAKKLIASTKSDLQTQLKALKAAPGDDFNRLKNKYQMNLDGAGNISQLLFGDQLDQWIPLVKEYYQKAQPIIEKLQEKKEEEKDRERLEGRFVSFPLANPQPDFLVERLAFSVHLTNGDLATEWADITHQQDVINRPTTLRISGEGFGKTALLDINGLFDYRGDKPINKMTLDMDGFKVKDLKLAGDKVLLDNAKMHITGQVNFDLESIDLTGKAKFQQTDFKNLGSSKFDKEMADILAKVNAFDINASAKGKILQPKINLSSNLDKMFADATKKRFQEKKAELEQELKGKLNEKMLSYTGEYQEQFKQLDLANGTMDENRKKIEGMLKSELTDFEAEQKRIAKQKADAAEKKAQQKAKDKLGDALKGLKF